MQPNATNENRSPGFAATPSAPLAESRPLSPIATPIKISRIISATLGATPRNESSFPPRTEEVPENFETKFWNNNDQNKLHELLLENGIKYSHYAPELILESAMHFLSDYECNNFNLINSKFDNKITNFWNTFSEFINPLYSDLKRPLSKSYNYNRPNLKFLI